MHMHTCIYKSWFQVQLNKDPDVERTHKKIDILFRAAFVSNGFSVSSLAFKLCYLSELCNLPIEMF